MDNYASYKHEAIEEINKISQQKIDVLVKQWESMFSPEQVKSNIQLLTNHALTFFNEIVSETDEKKEAISKKIESLQEERSILHRQLGIRDNIEFPNVPVIPLLDYQIQLDRNLGDFREELKMRKLQVKDLLLLQKSLCDALAEPPLKLHVDPLPSAEDIEVFEKNLDYLRNVKIERHKMVSELRSEIEKLSKELDTPILDETGVSILYNDDLELSLFNIDRLVKLKTDLFVQKHELITAISSLKLKLAALWNYLKVDDSVKSKYKNCKGHSQATYDYLKKEFDRCEDEKRKHIQLHVDRTRHDIVIMWNRTFKSDEEREKFNAFRSKCYIQNLLDAHQLELQSLKDFYAENQKLFKLYAEHEELYKRIVASERTNYDPKRLKNRGDKLLNEELERKKYTRELPKIQQQIMDLANEYRATKGKPFFVRGKNIVDVISGETEAKKPLIASAKKLTCTAIKRIPLSVNRRILMKPKNIHLFVDPKRDERPINKPMPIPMPVTKYEKQTIGPSLLYNRRNSSRSNMKRKSKNHSTLKNKTSEGMSTVIKYQAFQIKLKACKSSKLSNVPLPLRENAQASNRLATIRPPTLSDGQLTYPSARFSM